MPPRRETTAAQLTLTNSAALSGILFNNRSPAVISTYEGWLSANDNPNWKGSDRFFQRRSSIAVPARPPEGRCAPPRGAVNEVNVGAVHLASLSAVPTRCIQL